jgi:esterase/lipase superfamily enzyme
LDFSTSTDNTSDLVSYKQAINNKNVLLLIHGYNNDPNDVNRAYEIIEKNTKQHIQHFDIVVGYTWPGGDDGLDYFSAKKRASSVAKRFNSILRETMSQCTSLGIMSHSMGGRISLMALESLQLANHPKSVPVWQYLMATAVDNESIEVGERYYDATQYDDHSYIFHSKRDTVLKTAYLLAEWDRALGYTGPENVADIHANTKVANCKKKIKSHGSYKRTVDIYKYINDELSNKPRPRFSTL